MYKEYNDYELLDFVAENNEDAINIIHKKYEPRVINMAKEYFSSNTNLGLEINDLIQEGRLGLIMLSILILIPKKHFFLPTH